uniref:Uncharacterized protein n=1 Tax=Ditylenchus dipsaci TaxID=166011 RepID=A0A915EE25_9BILA
MQMLTIIFCVQLAIHVLASPSPQQTIASLMLFAKNGSNIDSLLDEKSEDYRIEAINVTMMIPELFISKKGIELNNASLTADLFKMLKPGSNYHSERQTAVNQFGIIAEDIENKIKALLEDRENFQSLPPYDSLIFTLYDSCMDNSSRYDAGSSMVINNLIALKHSSMQFITDWLISVYPITLFYNIGVGPDLHETNKNVLNIQPNSLFFGNEKYYVDPSFEHFIDQLKKYLRSILLLLIEDDPKGVIFKNSSKEVERRIDSFIAVEKAMALIQNNTDKHYDDAYADDLDTTVQEFQDTVAGSINWSRYIQAILPKEVLEKLSGGVSANPLHEPVCQVLSDFMDWRVILSDVGYLDERFLDAGFELDKVLQGAQQRPARAVECKSATTNAGDIRQYSGIFQRNAENNTWMDPTTKMEALNKLSKLSLQTGYMDSIFDDDKMRKVFEQLQLHPNMMEIEFASFSVNGFYYAVRNAIVITAGMLQGAFYNSSRPSSMNYGSIGAVLAHEITHGYDNAGRLHDENGNERLVAQLYQRELPPEKAMFIDQYNAIEVPESLDYTSMEKTLKAKT